MEGLLGDAMKVEIDKEEYLVEKEAREKRLLAYAEAIQERTMRMSQRIIDELVVERKNQNITQQELSNMTGIMPSNIARFESGKRTPTLVVLQKYAAAVGKHIEIEV